MKKSVINLLLRNKNFHLGIFILLFIGNISGQQNNYYSKTYNLATDNIDGFTSGIAILNDSIAYIQGFELKNNNSRPFNLTKINYNSGDTIWLKKYGDSLEKYYKPNSQSMIIIDNFIYCCGFFSDNSTNNFPFIFKLNFNGDTIWRKIYKNYTGTYSGFHGIKKTRDNKIIAGGVQEVAIGNIDFLISKIDTNGIIEWDNNYGISNLEEAFSIDTTSSGGFVLGGYRQFNGPEWQGYIVYVDSIGNLIWEKVLTNQFAVFIKELSNGNILAYLSEKTPSTSIAEGYAVILAPINGNIIYENTFEFSENSYTQLLGVVEKSNKLYFTGWAQDTTINNPAGILLKTNMSLDSLSSRWYLTRTSDNYLNTIIATPNNGFLMPGFVFSDGSGNTQDSWLLHTNCIGALELPLANATINLQETNLTEQISLINQSTEFEYSITDWGDFSSDTIYSPNDSLQNHQYALPGQFEITITTIACNDTSYWQTTLTVLPQDYDNNLKIFPNPTNGNLNLWYASNDSFTLSVFDDIGRLVLQEKINENTINSGYSVNLTALSSGIYLLNLHSERENLSVKVVKTE